MTQFIRLIGSDNVVYRINVDHIIIYHSQPGGAYVSCAYGTVYDVRNSVDEIDKLVNAETLQPTNVKFGEWIPWEGKRGCPVISGTTIEVHMRSGRKYDIVATGDVTKAEMWKHYGRPLDIVSYRIIRHR